MKKNNSSKEFDKIIESSNVSHKVWHKFQNWLIKTFGKDLYGEWNSFEVPVEGSKKKKKVKFRNFNEYELSKRLVGYEVMKKVEKFVKKSCPEIKIIHCDDSVYAGSDILLIPHPKHGITIMFIPQCTSIQNQFFLYKGHYDMLMKELTKMQKVYKGSI